MKITIIAIYAALLSLGGCATTPLSITEARLKGGAYFLLRRFVGIISEERQMSMKQILLAAMLTVALVGTTNAQSLRMVGAFLVSKETDAITDVEKNAIMTVAPGTSGSRGAALGWSCISGELHVSYMFGRPFFREAVVQYRFDQAAASRPLFWQLMTREQMARIMRADEVLSFTIQAKSAKRVTLRITDKDGEELTHTFILQGLSDALRALPCAGVGVVPTPSTPSTIAPPLRP